MEPFVSRGHFWLPSQPQQEVAGTLSFDPVTGASLNLIGGLSEFPSEDVEEGTRRILGSADGHDVTLERCIRTNERWTSPGPVETWRPEYILHGVLADTDEALAFERVTLELDGLARWASRSGTHREDLIEEGTVVGVTYSHRRVPSEGAVLPGGEHVEVSFGWSTSGRVQADVTLHQHCNLGITWPVGQTLGVVLADVKAYTDLLTMATSQAPSARTIRLHQVAHAIRSPIEYFASAVGARSPSDRPAENIEMLFTFDDIGGPASLAHWLTVARRFRRVLGGMTSIRYMPGMYVENRFLNLVHGAESFHRYRFPGPVIPHELFEPIRKKMIAVVPKSMREVVAPRLKYANEPFLGRRLAELVDLAGPSGRQAVGEGVAWGRVVSGVRNKLTHSEERPSPPGGESILADSISGGDVHFLTESIYIVLVLCLISECGAPEEALQRCLRAPSVEFVVSRLPEIIERIGPTLRR